MMNEILKKIYEIGIVPVVIINDAKDAVPLANALERGGILTAEVTFRTPAAKEAIKKMSKEAPNILVGAGTITSIKMVDEAIEAGAKYIVSPGLNPKVVAYCLEKNIPIIPGVFSPTEIELAMDLGLKTLKFFPSELMGGVNMLKALSSVYREIKFIPTGGISEDNLNSYLNLPNVLACGGSFMCPPALIDKNDFRQIQMLCEKAVLKMHDFSLLHVGLNSNDAKEAEDNVHKFANMFSLPVIEYPNSFFAGNFIEVVKMPFLGKFGHIAISTNNIDRAIVYFESKGYRFKDDGIANDEEGTVAIYFEEEIGGFAIHLRRK